MVVGVQCMACGKQVFAMNAEAFADEVRRYGAVTLICSACEGADETELDSRMLENEPAIAAAQQSLADTLAS